MSDGAATSLVAFATEKAAADREAFIAAAWRIGDRAHLLGMAQTAAIPIDEADSLLTRIDRLRPLRARLPELLGLRLTAKQARIRVNGARVLAGSIDKAIAEIDQAHAAHPMLVTARKNAQRVLDEADARRSDEERRAEDLERMLIELLHAERAGLAPRSVLSDEADTQAKFNEAKLAKLHAYEGVRDALAEGKRKLADSIALLERMQSEAVCSIDFGTGPIGIDDVRERITLTRSRMDDLEKALPAAAEAARAAGHSIATPTNAR